MWRSNIVTNHGKCAFVYRCVCIFVIVCVGFYDYFAECEIGVLWASVNSLAWSIGRSLLPLVINVCLYFRWPTHKLDLTKRKMSSNGSANVKHSEAMRDDIVTAMSRACGASIFLFFINLESICCPSYEMNAGSWQAWVLITWSWCMQYTNIEHNNKLL